MIQLTIHPCRPYLTACAMACTIGEMATLSETIRDSGLTLSEIHRRSGVSRATLSRIRNGRQTMSHATARKLAPVLGVSDEDLIQARSTRPAAPEVLQISALDIRKWGEKRRAEEELPELVSRLIRSELSASGSIRAPSDERIVEPGPDIAVEEPWGTRHVPSGRSVWEVSTAENVLKKATKDLARHQMPAGWRCDATSWIFVTTQPRPTSLERTLQQQSKNAWKSIRVFDGTDLKSWIDESLAVQLWLMDRMGLSPSGFQWLKTAVQESCSVTEPHLNTTLVKSSVQMHVTAWNDWVHSAPRRPLTVIGESRGEALLLIQALIEHEGSHPRRKPIEGICVNTEEGLRKLVVSQPKDIVVIPTSDVQELAIAHRDKIRVVLPATGRPHVSDALKVLPARRTAIQDFLVDAGLDRARAIRLARSAGGSISVLRRLTHKGGTEEPGFQLPTEQSQILAAAGLFGTWDAGSEADRNVVLRLTGQQSHEKLEVAWIELLNLPETPVWMDVERRGVNSRLDIWQRFTEAKITLWAIDRFFDAIEMALRDAPLHRLGQRPLLPKEYQALRDSQVSAELLRGLAEGLVLLAAFGDDIDPRLVQGPVSKRVAQVVFTALKDLTVDRLRTLHTILPLLAESAPEAFLQAMETDLRQANSAQKALLNFRWDTSEPERTSQFLPNTEAVSYRSPLMWAYETLAWFPDYAERAIDLLAKLADQDVLDHHGGQPRQSLAKLLKPWNCGSVLDSERHCAVLRKLAKNHSEWAFDLVRNCLPQDQDFADQANLPLWRGKSEGADSVPSEKHRIAVYRTATDILVQYAATSERTIHAAIRAVEDLPEKEAVRVWKNVATWAISDRCSTEERTRLVRELTALTDGGLIRPSREDNRESARSILNTLEQFQVTAPDLWLFDEDASIREHRPEDATWEITNDRLEKKRRSALQSIWNSGGIEAILSIISEVRDTCLIGRTASHVLPRDEINLAVLKALQDNGDADWSPMRWFIQGLLEGIDNLEADILIDVVRSSTFAEQNSNWLPCLLARFPFGVGAPRADCLSHEELNIYWRQFESDRYVIPSERKDWLIAGLCSATRPQAALWALRGDFEGARTESLRQLIDTLPQSREQNLLNFVKELVRTIRKRPDLSSPDAVRIEFMFFEILQPDEMPSLAKAVANEPSWFQHSLMLCVRRRDHAEDPPEWKERTENAPEWLRMRAHRLLRWLPRLPGTTSNGYNVDQGLAWTTEILSFADKHNRREAAEDLIGHAFGSAGFHKDGSPKDELIELIERLQCPAIEQGIAIAVSNQLGSVWFPDNDVGSPYKSKSDFYRDLEMQYRDSAPSMTRVMRIVQSLFRDQSRWANDRRRLDDHLDSQA